MYILVIGGASILKMFTVIAIFQSLIHLYNNMFKYDPSQLKGTIETYIGKETLNVRHITFHFAFHLPFNKLKYLSLKCEKLDTLKNHSKQLCVMLIDEVSLIGSMLLYHIEKHLHEIKHTLLAYFGNIDVIFSGDLFQVQLIKYSLIFELPNLVGKILVYDYSKEKLKWYELNMTMNKKDNKFIEIFNKKWVNQQSDEDIKYINDMCYKISLMDPLFPYLLCRNGDVKKHNEKMLSHVNEELIILQ